MGEVFTASRWTHDNLLFPTRIEVTDAAVIRRKRSWFTKSEMSIHLQRVASIRIKTGLIWSDLLVESTGGTDSITSHGHRKGDAVRIKELIETAQSSHLQGQDVGEGGGGGGTRACPFCAETIRAAAKLCRFCGRELPRG